LVLPSEQRVVEPGAFALFVGGSSKDADLLRLIFPKDKRPSKIYYIKKTSHKTKVHILCV
jgi:hypothetical protein